MSDLETHRRLYRLEQALADIRNPNRDPAAFEAIQSRADAVAALHGDRVPPPILGESTLGYRRRLLQKLQGHSPRFANSRFDSMDSATLDAVEEIVYHDAQTAAYRSDAQPGVLRAVESRDVSGRLITRYHGDVGAFLAPFVPQERQIVRIVRP